MLFLAEALPRGDRGVVSFLAASLWDPLALPARVAWSKAATAEGPPIAGVLFEPKDPSGVFALFELVSGLP